MNNLALHYCTVDCVDEATITEEQTKNWISTQLATIFSEDKEFLRKINKLCFGLMSGN